MKYAFLDNGVITGCSTRPNASSSVPVNEQSPEWLDFLLKRNRKQKARDIQNEVIARIGAVVPALNRIEMIELMVELWPSLDTASLGPDMLSAQSIYVYGKGKITQAQTATQAQLDAYDPVTDVGWP